jgi:hypothetical protein
LQHSKKDFENVFEDLGVVSTALNYFKKVLGQMELENGGKRRWWFYKKTLVITKCSLRTINSCNHITPVWDGA